MVDPKLNITIQHIFKVGANQETMIDYKIDYVLKYQLFL